MLIPHPLLGLRDAQEFTYYGDRNGAPYTANASISLASFVVIHE